MSPIKEWSTSIIFEIDDGSISICIILALGQNCFVSPVTLSSNLAPTAKRTSQLCIAMFASYVPCMPNIPRNCESDDG